MSQGEEEWLGGFQAVVDCTGTYPRGCWVGLSCLDYSWFT